MKNAGNACKYKLYRHIRTSKEIIKKSYLIYNILIGKEILQWKIMKKSLVIG